jgi:mannose-6-phosphate isomerase-like protein (cupin superfamily)
MKNPSFLGWRPAPRRRILRPMTTHTVRQIDELPAIMHGAVKLAGDALGVQTFGLQVLDFPAGFADYPAHDHAQDGQEEVYVVLAGSAEFEVAGARLDAGVGDMLRVDPAAARTIVPGEDGVRILAIGCVTNGAYERPDAFRVAGRP